MPTTMLEQGMKFSKKIETMMTQAQGQSPQSTKQSNIEGQERIEGKRTYVEVIQAIDKVNGQLSSTMSKRLVTSEDELNHLHQEQDNQSVQTKYYETSINCQLKPGKVDKAKIIKNYHNIK